MSGARTLTRHTPGPWRLSGTHTIFGSSKAAPVLVATVSQNGKTDWEANARLIAAAPDLLDILSCIVDSACDRRDSPEWLMEYMGEANAIVNSAESGSAAGANPMTATRARADAGDGGRDADLDADEGFRISEDALDGLLLIYGRQPVGPNEKYMLSLALKELRTRRRQDAVICALPTQIREAISEVRSWPNGPAQPSKREHYDAELDALMVMADQLERGEGRGRTDGD